jgi:hypothetical protein
MPPTQLLQRHSSCVIATQSYVFALSQRTAPIILEAKAAWEEVTERNPEALRLVSNAKIHFKSISIPARSSHSSTALAVQAIGNPSSSNSSSDHGHGTEEGVQEAEQGNQEAYNVSCALHGIVCMLLWACCLLDILGVTPMQVAHRCQPCSL